MSHWVRKLWLRDPTIPQISIQMGRLTGRCARTVLKQRVLVHWVHWEQEINSELIILLRVFTQGFPVGKELSRLEVLAKSSQNKLSILAWTYSEH